jgi:hemerythrin-like domain-containing protein
MAMANQFLSQLRKEHREVLSILDQLVEGDAEKGQLFSKLKEKLIPHLKAEEKVFYPTLLEGEESREDTLEAFEEHHVTELLFKEIDKMENSDERWGAKVKVLKELVNHHIKEEERNIFRVAKKEIKEEKLSSILAPFEKEKEKIMKHLG